MTDPDPIVASVRNAAMEYGVRFEVSSDVRMPVTACDQNRDNYGFGYSLAEAFDEFERRKAAKQRTTK